MVLVRGRAEGFTKIEVRILGTSLAGPLPSRWTGVPFSADSHEFESRLDTAAGGFYTVEIKATSSRGQSVIQTINNVGVGEVFIVSGQSNSTNYGEVRQLTQTGMVTTFDGAVWRLANDPQPGVQDNSSKGSFIPAFGDALYGKYHVPIGISSVGHGSTSVRQWLPAGTPVFKQPTMGRFVVAGENGDLVSDGGLFDGMLKRIRQFGPGGFRALLWHQGESDCHQPPEHEIPPATYQEMMEQLIQFTRRDAGWEVPWFVAIASYHTPADTGSPAIRDAQRKLAAEGLAMEGPDTDTLTGGFRQNGGTGTHFSDTGLKAHGRMWADAVSVYIDGKL